MNQLIKLFNQELKDFNKRIERLKHKTQCVDDKFIYEEFEQFVIELYNHLYILTNDNISIYKELNRIDGYYIISYNFNYNGDAISNLIGIASLATTYIDE